MAGISYKNRADFKQTTLNRKVIDTNINLLPEELEDLNQISQSLGKDGFSLQVVARTKETLITHIVKNDVGKY